MKKSNKNQKKKRIQTFMQMDFKLKLMILLSIQHLILTSKNKKTKRARKIRKRKRRKTKLTKLEMILNFCLKEWE